MENQLEMTILSEEDAIAIERLMQMNPNFKIVSPEENQNESKQSH